MNGTMQWVTHLHHHAGKLACIAQCLSGSFYNLYNKDWAAQCSPITIETLMLIDCAK